DSDPERVDSERLADLVVDELGERTTMGVSSPNQLAEQPAERVREVRVTRVGPETRLDIGKTVSDPIPVAQSVRRNVTGHLWHTGSVGQNMSDGDLVFSFRSIFRPIERERSVVLDETALGLNMQCHEGRRLGDRKNRKNSRAIDLPRICALI